MFLYYIYQSKTPNVFQKRIRNLVSLLKYRIFQNKRKVISVVLIIVLCLGSLRFIPKNLRIYFIDVGQGDACLIITPQNKTILIDGGGSATRHI